MKSYRNHRGQVVGELKDGVFRKKVSGEVHLFKNQDAWGIDVTILDDLPPETEIRILDKDTQVVYYTTAETFKTGTRHDFGHSPQYLLWRGLFDRMEAGVVTESPYKAYWKESMELWHSV